MVDPVLLRPPWLVAEALGTGAILGELSMILTGCFQTVRDYGAALPLDKCSVRGIHSFLAHIALGVEHITGLEQVTLVEVEPDGMANLLKSLFYVPVVLYSTSQRLFA